ncbi:FAD-dependent oxidoreductase [Atopococcus tabaci]|uniref:FAD-dependent oxidoreductase n=1 Tax=Atopococcus tabaci TaxID=269774 RepID=UPI0003F6D158|nr:FAD-dependent oxidoreductase [Atopococcus tabaci]
MTVLSSQTRKENIEKMASGPLDVLIIGGGITGAGLALEAGAKKMHAGLVEMQDFAAGTSSRSTKLVHGGLRYLKQFEVELVADVAQERTVINQNAPHIVQPRKMLLPVYDEPGASFSAFSAEVALDLYDRLAKVEGEWRHSLITREEVLETEPSLKEEGLVKGGLYLDYLNDDARLTLEILKKASELGTLLANYVKAVAFLYDADGKITGVKAEDVLTGDQVDIQASVVVNATGPWSDEVRKKQRAEESERMYPTKGVHLVVDSARLPVNRTIYTDTGLEDHRMIFVIPRKGKTYFGTTDTPYKGELKEPSITEEDIDYLLKAVNHRFPNANLTIDDIETGWAGLRPLIREEGSKDPSSISRGHEVFVSKDGLVTIAGGKLTDYRLMAEDTFPVIEKELKEKTGRTFETVDTRTITLSGGDVPKDQAFEEYVTDAVEKGMAIGLSEEDARELVEWYGTNAETVFQMKDRIDDKGRLPLNVSLALHYALEYEMALTPVDYFLRRTETLLFASERIDDLKEPVLDYMTRYFDWTEPEKDKWTSELEDAIRKTQLQYVKE